MNTKCHLSSKEKGLVNHSDEFLEEALVGLLPTIALTKREKEIFMLILNGHTNKDIARKLFRTERTIEYHRNSLMHKFGVHNIVELVKCAIEQNYV